MVLYEGATPARWDYICIIVTVIIMFITIIIIPSSFKRVQFLGAFIKFRKATICFVVFVRMPYRKEHFGSHRKVFMKFDFACLSKICQKIQVSWKSDKNNGYITWRPVYIFDHISLVSS